MKTVFLDKVFTEKASAKDIFTSSKSYCDVIGFWHCRSGLVKQLNLSIWMQMLTETVELELLSLL